MPAKLDLICLHLYQVLAAHSTLAASMAMGSELQIVPVETISQKVKPVWEVSEMNRVRKQQSRGTGSVKDNQKMVCQHHFNNTDIL